MEATERKEKIEVYRKGPSLVVEALKEFPKEAWQFRPGPGKWSIHEIIVHLADSEAMSFGRCRMFIAQPAASILAYDQDGWAVKTDYHSLSTDTALALFGALRQSTWELICSLPESVWNNTLTHPEHKHYTFDTWLGIYANHPVKHIEQMRRNVGQWRASK